MRHPDRHPPFMFEAVTSSRRATNAATTSAARASRCRGRPVGRPCSSTVTSRSSPATPRPGSRPSRPSPRRARRRPGRQRPRHPAELLVRGDGERGCPARVRREPGQGEGQQRQRLAGAGVVDQPRDQLLGHGEPQQLAPDPRSPPAAPPDAAGRAARPVAQLRPARGRRAAGRGTPAAAWPPPAPGRRARREQRGEPRPLRGGSGEQLLELVDDDQQVPRRGVRVG